ncbi:hypothetical protein CFC21_103702 [Triticum aestivum]|uniref:Glycosyltransferase n=3 Tax=Triticum TaxID=4564 RepID=A0A9R1N6M8_WHEAT|nr:crocetin glucosyltransferase, chloroplastic-like [Triticum aestivum]KAF7102596.1 hypothetical protein CFC21_103702 [Triticum aestivum]
MPPQPHFLVLTYPLQGHIAPALRLARRLLAAAPGALVTFSTTVTAHRRMFPAEADAPDGGDGRLEFLPFSDGFDNGYDRTTDPAACTDYIASFHAAGARSVGELVDALAARGRPVTRVVYTMLLPWAADVAREKGVPSALYWIQPAAVLAVYYHFFYGHAGVVTDNRHDPSFIVRLPGLPPLAVQDLPSIITESTDPSEFYHSIYTTIRDLFHTLDRETPRANVLVNTCQELEVSALAAMGAYNALPIGPVPPSGDETGLFKQDGAKYMEWLDTKPADSVVYVAFGSRAGMDREQLDELLLDLEQSGRPYLCVVRKDVKAEFADGEATREPETNARLRNGMVVEWCDQVRVLSHAAVGCFVTHCGWNSVMESLVCGVPMVCVPHMSDQRMNAWLVECEWRVGARAEVRSDGVLRLRATGVRQRVEEVMQEGEAGAGAARRAASEWKRVVAEALGKGGSSDRNLRAFVEAVDSGVSV